ncbi:MAG: hypothetical protein Q7V05_09850 [Methanoregula sp.]|nr:hypothetical protein [Methanoregula sp.]
MATHEDFFKKELVTELRNIAGLMEKEKNPEKKIYYFSAGYGITSRSYRYAFSSEVLLADLILNASYQTLFDRFKRIKSGETTVPLDEATFKKIEDGLWDLAKALDTGKPIQKSLEEILTASFSVSGPGYYLKEKGMLKL